MHIIELTELQFKNYSNLHSKKHYKQSVEYAKLKENNGFKPLYLGLVDEENNVHAATLILEKNINGKFKTGIEAKGITFAIQTFMVKLTGAISGALSLFLLGLPAVGWVNVEAENFEQLKAMGVTQTPEALDAFWLIYALIPALGYLASYIVWKFYKLNDKDVQIMAKCNAGEITKEEALSQLSRKY